MNDDPAGLDLGPAAGALLSDLGVGVRRATLLTALRQGTSPRRSYRLDLADGRTVKLRRAASAERAACYVGLVRDLAEPRLARVLAHQDDMVLEEWVPGTALADLEVRDWHRAAAAALLGALHATRRLADRAVPATVATGPTLDALRADLAILRGAGAVAASTAARLEAAARTDDPGAAAGGVVHTDLCPENLVEDPAGALRAIDNEALRLGPLGFDLARVWYRWPMAEGEWRRFCEAYAHHADAGPALAHFALWRIAAVARSARIRVTRGTGHAERALTLLAALAGGRAS